MNTKKGYAVKHIPFLWRREEDLRLVAARPVEQLSIVHFASIFRVIVLP